MNKWLLLSAALIASVSFANTSLVGEGPVSVQSYHSATMPTPGTELRTIHIEAISKKSIAKLTHLQHQEALQLTNMVLQNQKKTSDSLKSFQSQVDQNAKQVITLQAKLNTVENQVQTLDNVLKLLNKKIKQLQPHSHQPRNFLGHWVSIWQSLLGPKAGAVVSTSLFVLILLLIIWLLSGLRKHSDNLKPTAAPKKASKTSQAITADEEDEYDFMGSKEGVPAKLDLARAYIAMEDNNAAKAVLEEILCIGDEKQQAEARALLDTL